MDVNSNAHFSEMQQSQRTEESKPLLLSTALPYFFARLLSCTSLFFCIFGWLNSCKFALESCLEYFIAANSLFSHCRYFEAPIECLIVIPITASKNSGQQATSFACMHGY